MHITHLNGFSTCEKQFSQFLLCISVSVTEIQERAASSSHTPLFSDGILASLTRVLWYQRLLQKALTRSILWERRRFMAHLFISLASVYPVLVCDTVLSARYKDELEAVPGFSPHSQRSVHVTATKRQRITVLSRKASGAESASEALHRSCLCLIQCFVIYLPNGEQS